jgi:hypothetical protein
MVGTRGMLELKVACTRKSIADLAIEYTRRLDRPGSSLTAPEDVLASIVEMARKVRIMNEMLDEMPRVGEVAPLDSGDDDEVD